MYELEFLDRTMTSGNLASDVLFAGQPCGDWRLSVPAEGKATFHLVLEGEPWLHVTDDVPASRQLRAGDFLFFPRDASHVVTPHSQAPATLDNAVESVDALGAGAGRSGLICGRVTMEASVKRFLLAPLPEVVIMRGDDPAIPPVIPGIVTAMWHEARGQSAPLTATLNRLADVLIAQVIRHAISHGLVSSGLFSGLSDPQLRRALLALVDAPEADWTVESLAGKALMSRSAFAARFQAVVGRSPVEFMREWRMHTAAAMLRAGRSVADVAAACGYDSDASFAKAFKRVMGVGPGAVRRR